MNISQEGVLQVLSLHLLPLLDARSLSRLSCCNPVMKNLVYSAPLGIWVAAAQADLPIACALPDPCTRSSLQAALLRYTRALRGIRQCRWHHELTWSFPEPQFNSNGTHLACFADNAVRIRDAFTGQQKAVLQLGDEQNGWLRFRWGRSGTVAGLIRRSQAGSPSAGVGEMLDPAVAQQGWASLQQVPLSDAKWIWEQFDGPQWSPDLTRLLIQEEPATAGYAPTTQVIDATTGLRLWASQANMPTPPQWRSDSRAIVFFAGSPELGLRQHTEQIISILDNRVIWWATLSNGNVSAASAALNTHTFSPDGMHLCTSFPHLSEARILSMPSAVARAAHVLTMTGQGENQLLPASIQWAPDSRQHAAPAVVHPGHDSFLGIWQIDRGRILTVTLAELMTAGPDVNIIGDPMTQWAPDAKHLAVFVPTQENECVSIFSIEAHAPVCFMRTSAFALPPDFNMFELAWSPDSSQMTVSFVHERAMQNGLNGNGNNGQGEDPRDFVTAILSFV